MQLSYTQDPCTSAAVWTVHRPSMNHMANAHSAACQLSLCSVSFARDLFFASACRGENWDGYERHNEFVTLFSVLYEQAHISSVKRRASVEFL